VQLTVKQIPRKHRTVTETERLAIGEGGAEELLKLLSIMYASSSVDKVAIARNLFITSVKRKKLMERKQRVIRDYNKADAAVIDTAVKAVEARNEEELQKVNTELNALRQKHEELQARFRSYKHRTASWKQDYVKNKQREKDLQTGFMYEMFQV
jgi:hypothetical protein